jgi:hypothetical protein
MGKSGMTILWLAAREPASLEGAADTRKTELRFAVDANV